MDLASVYYLGTTALFLVIFAAIVVRTLSKKECVRGEQAKFRMMDDEYQPAANDKEDTHVR
jgi:3-deoxy-D-manno-octulosonic-acid transferase